MHKGVVFDIQRFCSDDGPGIRTTVFLKGCNLRCKWCHNPESLNIRPQLSYKNEKCISCQNCLVCPNDVHSFVKGIHNVDLSKCHACGMCVKKCHSLALTIEGKEMTSDEVIEEVLLDKNYYETTRGGVTFSGGEASIQPKFLLECLEKLKQENIHTCIESHGIIPINLLNKLCEVVDLFLIDFKHYDSPSHKKYTNASNVSVYNTLEYLNKKNKPVILRCPIIEGVNTKENHFKEIAKISQLDNVLYAQLLAYHSIGESKYENLQIDYEFKNMPSMTLNELDKYKKNIKKYNGHVI